ncbi:hypothetical protein DITRI_Ditri05aG0103100 [Diplodiscus trichospermus]
MEGNSAYQIKNICVFYGSNPGKNAKFVEAANNLGKVLAKQKIHLVYGGGSLGLMGCVSTAAHVGGSQVLGIIPTALPEGNFVGKTVGEELRVPTIQDMISKMLDNSDAFIALSGGIGTLEEIFQIASWAQLNIHHKPIGLLNIDGFFNKLLSFLDQAGEENFIPHSARQIFIFASTAKEMVDKLEDFVYKPDPVAAQIDWSKGNSSKKRKMDLSLHL